MQHSIIVREEILHSKADLELSEGLIPELLFRLIASSVKNPTELRLPSRGSTGQPGWDGIVVSPLAFDPFISAGQSYWEIGVGANPKKKATEDFTKRTAQTTDADRTSSTFVFVTPRSAKHGWSITEQTEWIDQRKKTTNWKDIRIIDATKLEHWLSLFPGIDLWLAQEYGITVSGLSFPHLHWESLKRYGSPPDLSPDVYLLDRANAIDRLLRLFRGETTELLLRTRYPEAGVDFVTAFLASLDAAQQAAYGGRCLIIGDPETWRVMCALQNAHIFVATNSLDVLSTNASLRNEARNKGHGVVFAGIPLSGTHGNSVDLTDPKPYDLEKVLISCGYSAERARSISNKCEGRTTIMKRLLLDVSASPDWVSSDHASDLSIAILIGQWNGNVEGDRTAVEGTLGKTYGEWLRKIRSVTLRPDPPLIQRDERWRFVSRFEGWLNLGSYIANDDLDRFQKQAMIVLREKDPKFTLPPEERWKASLHDKNPKYSDVLREGFAESLALLATYPKALSSCSIGKPESIAIISVNEILRTTDWVNWASINDVLPLLAEAAPEQFLDVVEDILNDTNNRTFHDLFAQEGSGILGSWNYMTGVLWALETLAWHQDYLARVAVVLGHLAEIDPHLGNWANRPENSLTTIFLPWLPQTCAPVENRKTAVEALLRECPDTGWKLLLALLPSSHQVTSGSRKPSWREFIPPDHSEKISRKEHFEQVTIYANLAVCSAKTDLKKLTELIDRLDDLPPPAHSEILQHLSSGSIIGLADTEKVVMWEALTDLVVKHRKFATANWAMPKDQVDSIAVVAEKLKPTIPQLLHRRLFCQREFELVEEKGNYEEQWRELENRRTLAIQEILDSSGVEGLLEFVRIVTESDQAGLALGRMPSKAFDSVILPEFLINDEKPMERVAAGYVWSRFNQNGWSWADNLGLERWTNDQKATFLAILPFGRETWQKAKILLGVEEALYWQRTDARPYNLKEDLSDATELLLRHGRARAAIQCLYWMLHEKQTPSIELVSRALMENLSSKEPVHTMDQHACTDLIQWLQNTSGVGKEVLFKIEWNYLPLLDHHFGLSPKTLETQLAEDPAFFAEIIHLIFRSEKEPEAPKEPSEHQKQLATHAYDLLHNWNIPPGSKSDGSFDADSLRKWVNEAKRLCEESGHLRISLDQIGKILAHSPADPNGLWLHRASAEILNEAEHDVMRTAFRVELFNQRGVHWGTTGADERRLATEYRQKADAVNKEGYFRLASSLRNLAESYERDAEREAASDPFDL